MWSPVWGMSSAADDRTGESVIGKFAGQITCADNDDVSPRGSKRPRRIPENMVFILSPCQRYRAGDNSTGEVNQHSPAALPSRRARAKTQLRHMKSSGASSMP